MAWHDRCTASGRDHCGCIFFEENSQTFLVGLVDSLELVSLSLSECVRSLFQKLFFLEGDFFFFGGDGNVSDFEKSGEKVRNV